MSNTLFFSFFCAIQIVYGLNYASPALRSVPKQSALPAHASKTELHPTGRRWKRRRKQQTFFPSPCRSISTDDEIALQEQMGYVPPNICSVSAKSGDFDDSLTRVDAAANHGIGISSKTIGRPVAIRSYPLLIQQLANDDNDKTCGSSTNRGLYENCNVTPFPTMYWLSDAHISRAISELERQGFVREFQLRLENDESLTKKWLDCHAAYAMERWNLLSSQDRNWLSRDDIYDEREQRTIESMRDMIQCSGVAGTDYKGQNRECSADGSLFVPSVKCLHSHYAHYRSQLSSDACKSLDSGLNIVGVWTHELLLDKFSDIVF
jgi:hypothetical protein